MTLGLCVGSMPIQAQKQKSPTVLTVEGETVSKADFELVYNKNNNINSNIEQKSPQEYMELFINYKLKVQEAESMGLDTVAQYKKELEGYVNQLSAPYLVDNEFAESLVKEAYDRLQEDVKASHILIKLSEDASPQDTLKAFNKINEVLDKARGGADFGGLAMQYSEDPSAKQNKGELGYFSALRMVYPFESAAYNTAVSEISKPVRTSYGYHIIKVEDRRSAIGQIRAAHIMVAVKPEADEVTQQKAKEKIDELYNQVTEGGNFEQLARLYSDDRGSKSRGGELPWFGSGRMVPEFEQAAFALAADGDISQPIKTQYGWHIIKRLEKKNTASYEEEYDALKKKVERDRRGQGSKQALAKKLMTEYSVKEYGKNLEVFNTMVDSSYFNGQFKFTIDQMNSLNKPLFIVNDKNYKGEKTKVLQFEFASYLELKSRRQKPVSIPIYIQDQYKAFRTQYMLDYEESILAVKYPEYRALVQEYRDGILLFELMDQKVWKKAVTDTAGLEAFYEAHKTEFMWGDRVDASVYTCNSQENMDKVKAMLEEGASDSAIIATTNVESQLGVDVRSGLFAKNDMAVLSEVNWQKGTHVATTSGFAVVVINEVLAPQPKTLNEARGLVTSAYQNELETSWLSELRSKYTFSVDQEVLESVKSL